ncbi:MAG: hypothetical protein EBV03_02920 [Proteobacteria bacterium]|nr:hypothetical protein [Pseudomonadota bacterium]
MPESALMQAIKLNGVSVEFNQQSFAWGRLAAHDLASLEQTLNAQSPAQVIAFKRKQSLDELISHRTEFLSQYQNAAYAQRYRSVVERVRADERRVVGETESLQLTEAVARYLFKLMAYKDEYEVARLYTDPQFMNELKATFQGDYTLRFNLAPPIMEQNDPATGRPKKREFGAWMLPAFRVLAKFKFLRGTAFDIFGFHADRRAERQLIADYEQDMALVLQKLSPGTHDICAELLALPEEIRGYGPVKEANLKKAYARRAQLRAMLEAGITHEQRKSA